MDANLTRVQQSFLTKNVSAQKLLKGGDQVLVRVTGDLGNGKYSGSVAGVKILLNAKGLGNTKLLPGSTFVATANINKGQLQIIPKNLPVQLGQLVMESPFTMELANQEAVLAFLQNLGLPPDEISLHLLQQFKQMEMKMNPSLLSKIRNLAVKIKGKEKSAVELLALLAEKNLSGSEDELLELMAELDGDFSDPQNGKNSSFSLMNKINSEKGKWYLLPFEIVQAGNLKKDVFESNAFGKSEVFGTGSIRVLMDNEQKPKLLNILCNYSEKKYLFSLAYEGSRLKEIRMNITPCEINEIEAKTEKLKKMILRMGKSSGKTGEENKHKNLQDIAIVWCESSEIEGSACGLEDFVMVDGEV